MRWSSEGTPEACDPNSAQRGAQCPGKWLQMALEAFLHMVKGGVASRERGPF